MEDRVLDETEVEAPDAPSSDPEPGGGAPLSDERAIVQTFEVLDPFKEGLRVELRFKKDGVTKQFFATTKEQALEITATYKRDSFAMEGLNPRKRDGGKKEDVAYVQTVFLDLDVDRPKDTPATQEQRKAMLAFHKDKLLPWIKAKGFTASMLIDSGNGIQVVFIVEPIDPGVVPDIDQRSRCVRNLLVRDLGPDLAAAGLEVDNTHDMTRMLKIPGTRKPLPDHRVAVFLEEPARRPDAVLRELLLSEAIKKHTGPEDDPLPVSVDLAPADFMAEVPEDIVKLIEANPRMRSAFRGELTDLIDKTRSAQDMSLTAQLVRAGCVDAAKLGKALWNTVKGKAREQKDAAGYIARTIAKVLLDLPAGMRPGGGSDHIVGDSYTINPAQDFKDGTAMYSRRVITYETIEGKRARKITTCLITSDRRSLPIEKPKAPRGVTLLAEVPGTSWQIDKSYFEGTENWPLEGPHGLRRFLDLANPNEKAKPVALFRKVLAVFNRHVHFLDERDAMLCAVFTMHSFVYRIFRTVPYLHLHGVKGSGKSICGHVFEALGFNTDFLSHMTPASLFRIADCKNGLMVIDEAETFATRERSADDPRAEILKAGYQKGARVARQDTGDYAKTNLHDVYCPKVICNIFGLDDILNDRVIKVQMHKATAEQLARLEGPPPEHSAAVAQAIRAELYVYGMTFHALIDKARSFVESEDLGIHGRERDLYLPLLAHARVLDAASRHTLNLERTLLDLAVAKRPGRKMIQEEGPEEILARVLRRHVDAMAKSGEQSVTITTSQVHAGWDEESDDHLEDRLMGRLLHSLGAEGGKRKRVRNAEGIERWERVYLIKRKIVEGVDIAGDE